MTKIHITASKEYDVCVGRGLLAAAGEMILSCCGSCRVVIVSDDNVYPLYGENLIAVLKDAGIQSASFVFQHGEAQKTLKTYGELQNFLCENKITRKDLIVALGGGVVGDLAGFAAATYQRGIRFVQIPTTLLAMVDSSVGGKTAVDLDQGKNQVGCFYQPSLVICDPDTLESLPEDEFKCGCAEVIKYSVLGNRDFFDELCSMPIMDQIDQVICTCVKMKSDIVAVDEFDLGIRQKLNLGHTIGHGIEACSEYTLQHGKAVAAGIALITKASVKRNICNPEAYNEIVELLKANGLPTTTDYPAKELFSHALADKKKLGAMLTLVVPETVGACRLEKIRADEFIDWLNDGGIQ